MNTKIGCALVGCGGMGSWHATRLSKNELCTWIGGYDILPERTAKLINAIGGTCFDSLAALLADPRVELVVVATPNDVHHGIVIEALAAGRHVVCEKPVAMNSTELAEMIAAAEKAQRLFTVHQNRRWDSDFLTIKKIFDDNTLGPVHAIESRVHGSRGIPGDWRNQPQHGGGMVLDWGVHILDQALMLAGSRRLVSLYAQLEHITNTSCDDGFRVTLNFEGDLTYIAEVGTSNFISLPRWYILGENGSAVIHDWSRKGEIVMVSDWENRDAVPIQAGAGLTKTMAPRTDDTIKSYPLPEVESDWGDFYRNVFATIRGEAQSLITHQQQRRLMLLLEAVFQSAATNQVVTLNL